MKKIDILNNVSFGERVAEEDIHLEDYFVETSIWKKLFNGDIDIIKGVKGAGKSALYKYLLAQRTKLEEKNVILISAETLKGTPIFKSVLEGNQIDERTFQGLWKMYILTLIGSELKDRRIKNDKLNELIDKLEHEKLLEDNKIKEILINVRDYVMGFFKRKVTFEVETSAQEINSVPIYKARIAFGEPTREERDRGMISVDKLLDVADEVLKDIGKEIWITFDRLDVAFAENSQMEKIALKTLFSVYNDLKSANNIKLKIFIREDIWKRITEDGFREGSHITKQVSIKWNEQDLLYLLLSRIVENKEICNYVSKNKEEILADNNLQVECFYKIFPNHVETGKASTTFQWMISRTQDGLKFAAPREMIHLMNEAKNEQVSMLEKGIREEGYDGLITNSALKKALKEVSKVRLEQTIYSEYPQLKTYIFLLEKQKTEYTVQNMSTIFGESIKRTQEIIKELVEIGFVEEKKAKLNKNKGIQEDTYWIPFLYRDALNLVRGKKK